jgi:hypothetical protein
VECGNTTDFSPIEIPYAYKLLLQELERNVYQQPHPNAGEADAGCETSAKVLTMSK